MRRFAFWVIILSLLGLGVLLYFKFSLPQQDSTVYLKDNSPPLQGHVTKKDDYLILSKGGVEQLIPWGEVKSVSGPNPVKPELSRFSFWVDKIDFLSSLGVMAALVVFSVGLYQYQQGLTWKKEEFLAGLVKSFGESQKVQNAMQMMESLIQYDGDEVELYPHKDEANSSVRLSNTLIIDSLSVHLSTNSPHAPRIRSAFDTFLDYMERFDHYIRIGLIDKKSLYVHVGYWIDILGRHEKLREGYRIRILHYATNFGYGGVVRLLNRYNRAHRFWFWVRSIGAKKKRHGPEETTGTPPPRNGHHTRPSPPNDHNASASEPVEPKNDNDAEAAQKGLTSRVASGIITGFIVLRLLFKARTSGKG